MDREALCDLGISKYEACQRTHFEMWTGQDQEQDLSDGLNTVIEEHLDKFGVICLEDLIHETAFPGVRFQITHFLKFFHLSVARHATKNNRVDFLKEMDSPGYWGERINQLMHQLN